MYNVVKVMGAGCANEELQHCPDEYHFELTTEELIEAIKNPRKVGRDLGLKSAITSVHVSVPDEATPVIAGGTYCCRNCLSDSICCLPWPQQQ